MKSFGNEPEDEKKGKKMDSENEEADDTLFDDGDEPEEKDDVEKGCMKKSFDEDDFDADYLDATELLKSMGETMDAQAKEIETLKKSLEEVQENMITVTKSFGDFLKTPNNRVSVVEKSMDAGSQNHVQSKRPTTQDFDILKSALCKASREEKITLDEVQFYNREFQKAMAGQKINPNVWTKICSIVKENR